MITARIDHITRARKWAWQVNSAGGWELLGLNWNADHYITTHTLVTSWVSKDIYINL